MKCNTHPFKLYLYISNTVGEAFGGGGGEGEGGFKKQTNKTTNFKLQGAR